MNFLVLVSFLAISGALALIPTTWLQFSFKLQDRKAYRRLFDVYASGSIMPKVPSLQLSESSMAFNRPLSPQDLFSINDLSIQISNNVLEDYSMTGNWQAAEQVICLMNERNISPDELTYSLILSAYLNGNQVISAEEQATEMIRAGYMPERSMLCALIVMLGKSDMPHRAERLFHRIVSESKNASSVDLYDAIITAWSCSSSADKYSMIEDLYDRVMFLSLVPTPNIVLAYLYAHTQLTHTCSPDKAYSVYVEYGHLLDGFDGNNKLSRQRAAEYILTSCLNAIGTKRMQGKVMQIVNMVISSLPKDQYSHSIQSKLMSILSSLESEESLHKSRKLFRWAIQHNVTSAGIYEAMVKKCIQLIPLNAPLCLDILMEEVLPSIHNCQVQISENLYILTIRRLSQALTSDQMMNRVIRGFILGQSNLISSVRIWDAIIDCAVSRYADMDGGFVDSILEIMRSHEVAFSTNTYEMVAGYFLNTQRYGELDRLIGVVMDASDGSNFGKDDNSADVDENAGDSAQMSLVLTYIHILSRIRRDSRKDNLANLLVSFKSLCTKYKERKANSLKSSTPIVYADCNEKINIAAALDQEGFAFIYHIYLLLLQYPCQDRHHMALHSYMMHTLSHIEDSLTLVTETPTYPYYVSGGSNSSYASGNSVMVLDLSMEILQNVQRLANKDHDNMSVEENFYVDFLKVLINSLPVKSEFIVSKAYDVYKHLNHTFSASNNSLSTSFYTKLFTLFAKSQRNHVPKLVDAIIADHSVSAVDGDVLQSMIAVYTQGKFLPTSYNKVLQSLQYLNCGSLSKHTLETLVVYFFDKWQNANMNTQSVGMSPTSSISSIVPPSEEYANMFLYFYLVYNEKYEMNARLYLLFLQYWVARGQVDLVLYSLSQLCSLSDSSSPSSLLQANAIPSSVFPPAVNYTHLILVQPTVIHLPQALSMPSITFYSALSKCVKKFYNSSVNIVFIFYEFLQKLKMLNLPAKQLTVAYNMIFFAYIEDIESHAKNKQANKVNSLVDDMYNLFVSMMLNDAGLYPNTDHCMFHAVIKALVSSEKSSLSPTRVKKVGSLVDRYIFQHGNMLDARTFHLLVSLYEKNNPIEAFQLSSKLLPYILYPTKTSGKKVIEQVVTTMLNVFGHKYPLQCSRLALQCLESKIYLDSLVINEILSHLLHYAYSSSTAFMYPNTTSLAEYVYYSETLVNYCYKLGMKISAGSYHGIFQLIMSGQHDSTVEMAPALYKAFSKIEFTGSMMDKYILVHFYHSLLRLTDITDYTHKISQYAMQAYSQAIHGGVVPNLQVYHLLLQLLSRGRVSVVSYVDTLLKDMVDKFGISPDVVVYNMALQCYVKSNVPYADPRIDSILQSMQRRKLYPSLVTYSILLQSVSSGLSKSQPTLHHVELATKIFNNMLQAGITPDVKAWTILISIWCESNVADKEEQVLELVQKMETAGMHPNYITYTVMLSMWGMSKHPKASLYVREILLRMRKEHMQLDHMLFSSLLSALSKSRAPDAHIRSLEVLDSMVVHRVLPNAFHYSAVMNVFVHSNSTDKELVVMGLYDRMMKESCPPNSVIYSLMLHAWRNSTLPQAKDEVRKIYDIILDKRLSLDSRLMHNLLHALLKHFPHIEVYTTYIDRLIQHTLNYDLYVDKDVFKPLLRLFDLSIDVKKQLTLLVIKWMEQCKVQYDDVSVYQLCINNLCDINRFESEAIRRHNIENLDKLLAVLNEKQLTLDSYVYSKYCRMFAFIGNPRLLESIYGWLEHMVDRKVILEADTMRSMIKLHSINGTSSSVDLLNRLVLLYISSPKNGALGSDTMQFLMKMWTRQPNSAQVLEGTIALMEILSWKVLTRTLNMTAAPNGISDRNSLLMQIVSTMLEKQHHLMGIYSPSLETYDIYLSTLLTSLSFLRTNAELMRRVAYTFPAMMSELSVALKERKKYTKSSLEWKNGVDKNLGDVDQLLSRIEDSLKKFAIGVKVGFS